MITLEVCFSYNDYDIDGTAVLYENLISGEVKLILSTRLYINEAKILIDKAVNILKLRYKDVKININWDNSKLNKGREEK
ncbi:MAG: hypothetical protein ACI31S_02030 [Bacilli bacterium]